MDMNRKPLIGLTTSHNIETEETYQPAASPRAVLTAGGIPVILPLEASEDDLEQLVSVLDGFLFTGGPDVHPFLFGEETLAGCGGASVQRDRMELALLRLVIEQKKPILGICRGIQLINIGLGGTIYQDIPSQVKQVLPIAHQQPFPHKVPSHTVEIATGNLLADVISGHFPGEEPASREQMGGASASSDTNSASMLSASAGICHAAETSAPSRLTLRVNSTHHQAVRDVAPPLKACAFAPDGIIEGVVMKDYPFLIGVQWHPEYLWKDDTAAMNLFTGLIRASSKRS